jgi:hypothetical protein
MKKRQQMRILLFRIGTFLFVPIAFLVLIIVLALLAPMVRDTEN